MQEAVHFITEYLAMKFNHKVNNIFIYNTYQMYLYNKYDQLEKDILKAKQLGYILGIKLVRGAYLNSEKKREKELNIKILQDSKLLVDEAYFKAIDLILRNIADADNKSKFIINSQYP